MPQGKVGAGSRCRTLNPVGVTSQVRVVGEWHSHPSPGELVFQGKAVQGKAEGLHNHQAKEVQGKAEVVQGKAEEVQGKAEGLRIHRGMEVQGKVEGLVRKDQPTTVEGRLLQARGHQIGKHFIMEGVVLVQQEVLRESSYFLTHFPQKWLHLEEWERDGIVGYC